MRLPLGLLVCALVFLAGVASAEQSPSLAFDATGQDLYKATKEWISPNKTSQDQAYKLYVTGYFTASAQATELILSIVKKERCRFPANASIEQIIHITKKFLEENPQIWDVAPPQGIINAAIQDIVICIPE